jgi:hypothetical protein
MRAMKKYHGQTHIYAQGLWREPNGKSDKLSLVFLKRVIL